MTNENRQEKNVRITAKKKKKLSCSCLKEGKLRICVINCYTKNQRNKRTKFNWKLCIFLQNGSEWMCACVQRPYKFRYVRCKCFYRCCCYSFCCIVATNEQQNKWTKKIFASNFFCVCFHLCAFCCVFSAVMNVFVQMCDHIN